MKTLRAVLNMAAIHAHPNSIPPTSRGKDSNSSERVTRVLAATTLLQLAPGNSPLPAKIGGKLGLDFLEIDSKITIAKMQAILLLLYFIIHPPPPRFSRLNRVQRDPCHETAAFENYAPNEQAFPILMLFSVCLINQSAPRYNPPSLAAPGSRRLYRYCRIRLIHPNAFPCHYSPFCGYCRKR